MSAPLVPAGVDLRGLPWMRLDTSRLLDSDLFALSTGEEFKAAVALWCKAWTQAPAGSLPTDDRILAHLSGTGGRWKRVKAMALRGWIECDDGRLYHPVVAEQALAAWAERQEFRAEVDGQLERKRREREERAAMFEQLKASGHSPAWNTPTGKLRELVADLPDAPVTKPVTPPVTPSRDMSRDGHGDSHGLDGTGRDLKAKALSPESSTGRTRDARPHAPADDGPPTGRFEGHEHPQPAPPNPVAPFAIALNLAGARCTAMNPDLVAYVAEGGTVEHLAQVADHPDCRGKPATYIARFARRELAALPAEITTTGPPTLVARNGSAPSKSMQAIAALEAMKPHEPLVPDRDPHRAAEAHPALPGPDAGG